jgi:hypothetical protein
MEVLKKYRVFIIIGILIAFFSAVLIFLNFTQNIIPERSIFVFQNNMKSIA